jgi:lipopolysaccharide/colanic/teichoic acid biosynthesis glycosyltransferase/GT2 family glycosyltransferase
MSEVMLVTVIMPCRNEAKYIERCLDSIVRNDYPSDGLEVLVIDGMSTDGTRGIVEGYVRAYPFIRLMDNPRKVQTLATNIGLGTARGDVIIRMDAHAEYPEDFISKSVHWLKLSGADCVGGVCVTRPGADTPAAKAIALALSHPFGVGNSYFRTASSIKEPRPVDTVPFGCYRKEVFERVGLFNKDLDRTDDIEFNLRLKRAGGKILLVPDIKSYYHARPDLRGLFRQNFGNGFWVIYSLKYSDLPFSPRHLVPFLFLLSLLGPLALSYFHGAFLYLFAFIGSVYFLADVSFSLGGSMKRSSRYFPLLAMTFPVLHFSYGLGSFWGMGKLILKKPWINEEMKGPGKSLSPFQRSLKRGLDLAGSTLGLLLTWWIILPAFVAASIDTRKSGFFTQERVGRYGRLFKVIKIRTMRNVPDVDTVVTTERDPRITPLGRFFRRFKVDELPQLINVFLGQMSFVGPRPDVPGFADVLEGEDRVILSVRPGITGPATLKYRDEEKMLAAQEDPERYNSEVIFPDKVRLNRKYVEDYSFLGDIRYILKTIFR